MPKFSHSNAIVNSAVMTIMCQHPNFAIIFYDIASFYEYSEKTKKQLLLNSVARVISAIYMCINVQPK